MQEQNLTNLYVVIEQVTPIMLIIAGIATLIFVVCGARIAYGMIHQSFYHKKAWFIASSLSCMIGLTCASFPLTARFILDPNEWGNAATQLASILSRIAIVLAVSAVIGVFLGIGAILGLKMFFGGSEY